VSSTLSHATTYGFCQKPFGVVRTRIVEFLAQVFSVFPKEVHHTVFENGLYNTLLHYFELYPFHNILHQKVCDIFMTTLEKNYEELPSILERTDLVKMILETSKDGSMYKFEGSERQMARGYNAFVRKLSNKVVAIQKQNEEANNILESIPEWRIYATGDLAFMNDIESKPLAQDPRKKNEAAVEDDIEYFFKIKSSFNHQSNKLKTATEDNKQEDNEDDDGEEVDFEQSQNKVEYEPATGESDEIFKNIMESRDVEYSQEDGADEDLHKYLSNEHGDHHYE
jgi:hypothetical protein